MADLLNRSLDVVLTEQNTRW